MANLRNEEIKVKAQPDARFTIATLCLSQNENGRLLEIEIQDLDIPAGSLATFVGTKPDGVLYSTTGTIADNVVSVQEDSQMTAAAGEWDARINIVNGGNTLGTARIRMMIIPDTAGAGAIPSDSVLDGVVAECRAYAYAAVNSAYYGSPLVALAAAAMTDEDKVYVYTGSETGYTAGNWYYYDGEEWVSGGVYNSVAVQTDTALAVLGRAADAWATGEAIRELESQIEALDDTSIVTPLGNTPVTLEDEARIRLVAAEQTEYVISGLFLADYESETTDDVEVRFINTTLTKQNGKLIFTSNVETAGSPFQCWVDLRLDNLTVGDTYTLTVTWGQERGTTGGYFEIYDRDGNRLGTLDVADVVESVSFTATTTFARVRLYPTTNYYYETYGITTATLVSAVVTSQQSGSFNGRINLGILAGGVTISATPACSVFSIAERDDVIGRLSDLNTTAKNNLVAAINEAAESSGTKLSGKRCVFLGDSVSAFQFPPNDIPSIVGELTGMEVVNAAFGGCRITDTIDYTQDGYGAFSMVRLVDSIISGDWTIQDNGIGDLVAVESEYSPTSHLAALKAVNWNNVDFLVVHWAGNDPGNVRFDDPTNEFNTKYYLGAWRYCIKKLLEAHPQLQILYVSATYHEWPSRNESTDTREYVIDGVTYHYYDWADAIIAENKKLAIPSLDFYRESGLNKYNIAYYMSSDRTHPKPIGNRMMANKIAAHLLARF